MGAHRVQIYFLDRIDNISAVSMDELKRLFDYRENLKSRGILYRTFKDDNELAREIRVNLQRPMLDFLRRSSDPSTDNPEEDRRTTVSPAGNNQSVSVALPDDVVSEQELGVLDHAEQAEQAIMLVADSMERISTLIQEMGQESNKLTEEIERTSSSNIPIATRKRTVNEFARLLKSKAVELTELTNTARQNYDLFANSVIMGASLEREYGDPDAYKKNMERFLAQAEDMLSVIPEVRTSITGLRAGAASLPRITVQFNQAKKQLVDALTGYLEFLDQTEGRIFEITAKT
jgi:hypothetical protein